MKRISILIIILFSLLSIDVYSQTDSIEIEKDYSGDIVREIPGKIIETTDIEVSSLGERIRIKNPFGKELDIEFLSNDSWIERVVIEDPYAQIGIVPLDMGIYVAPNTGSGRVGVFYIIFKGEAYQYNVSQAGNGTINIHSATPMVIQAGAGVFDFQAYTDWAIDCNYTNLSFDQTSGTAGHYHFSVHMSEGSPITEFRIHSVPDDGLWEEIISVTNITDIPILSEVRESDGGLMAIELFNPTTKTIRLNYYGLTFFEGDEALTPIPLTGAIGSGQVFVITSPEAPEVFRERANLLIPLTKESTYTGIGMTLEDMVIDKFNLSNANSVRDISVDYPRSEYNAAEWVSVSEIDDLGMHKHHSIALLSATSTENYVLTQAPALPIKSENELSSLNLISRRASIAYLDGLGRPNQEVAVAASPQLQDVVSFHSYDDIGREYRKNLPYVKEYNQGGAYATDPDLAQLDFYNNPNNTAPLSATPFAEKKYDESPLNRVLKQGAPGEDWQIDNTTKDRVPNEHIVSYKMGVNGKSDVVRWRYFRPLRMENIGHYAEGALYRNASKDENGHEVATYTDMQGRTILKRSYDETGSVSEETYYVYDEFSQLIYVIPPKAAAMGNSGTVSSSTDWVANLCYHYRYDGRGRMKYKKLPGAEPVLMVYDNRDRLVLTQDGNQRPNNEWTFIAYDALNRDVVSGYIVVTTSNENTIRNTFDDPSYTTLSKDATGNYNLSPITGLGIVQDVHTASITYYDDYNFPGAEPYANCPHIVDQPHKDNTTGMVTGSWECVGEDETGLFRILTTTFYDDYGRVIRQKRDINVLGGYFSEYSSYAYNFRGDVIEEIIRVQRPEVFLVSTTEGSSILLLRKRMSYDHMGNLLQTDVKVDGMSPWITTSEMSYSELGQLIAKKLGNSAQKVDFTYNIRGWLTAINDVENQGNDLFAMALAYDNTSKDEAPANPQYNGNIAEMIWNTSNETGVMKQSYEFDYDYLNRIKLADFSDLSGNGRDYSVDNITYDKNGNIETLNRMGGGSLIDELHYDYDGNQLKKVDDWSGDGNGVPDLNGKGDNTYDDNGNLINHPVRSMQLTYDRNNLPKTITIEGHTINNYFTAGGSKVLKKAGPNYRYYIGAAEVTQEKGFEYIHLADGRIRIEGKRAIFDYTLKDHLGNTRAMFTVDDKGVADLLQSNDYYPFGMRFNQSASFGTDTENKYLYNGKELQMDYGLDWYDYGARFYDPATARWSVIDNKAEKYYFTTPYAYAVNNPMRFVDPDGNDIVDANGQKITYSSKNGWSKNATADVKIIHRALMQTPKGAEQWNKAYNNPDKKIQLGLTEEVLYTDDGDLALGTCLPYATKPNGFLYEPTGKFDIEISLPNIKKSSKNEGLSTIEAIGATAGHEIEHTSDENANMSALNKTFPRIGPFTINEREKEPNKVGREIRNQSRELNQKIEPRKADIQIDQRELDPSQGGFY